MPSFVCPSTHTGRFGEYVKCMMEVEAAKVPSRQEADKILSKAEPVRVK